MLILSCHCYAQSTIAGVVLDTIDQPLLGASVIVKDSMQQNIIAFTITQEHGKFKIDVASNKFPIYVEVRHLNYQSKAKWLEEPTNSQVKFRLQEGSNQIEDVVLEYEIPIRQKKDTIEYSASSFTDRDDVVLADVMKKMPGIEIDESGIIYYQGTEINKYYIEDLDLLGDGYNLANENLPVVDVDKVQVLENHQPIKMLDSLVYSEKAAINIKLKSPVSISGVGEAYIGASPFLWKGRLTPMFFSNNTQAIFSVQGNNIGKDISRYSQLFQLGNSGSTIQKYRWFDNKSFYVSPNVLLPLNKSKKLQLRVNGNLKLQGMNRISGNEKTYFVNGHEIELLEQVNENKTDHNGVINLELENNSENFFFNNSLQYIRKINEQATDFIANLTDVAQKKQDEKNGVNNQLKVVVPMKEHIITFHSEISISDNEAPLFIEPGVFQSVFNQNEEFDLLEQQNYHQLFKMNNSASYSCSLNNWLLTSEIGFESSRNDVQTSIYVSDQFNRTKLSSAFQNNQEQKQRRVYVSPTIEIKKNSLTIKMKPQLSIIQYKIFDRLNDFKFSDKKVSFEPSIQVSKSLNSQFEIRGGSVLTNRYGSLQKAMSSYVVNNYRTISRYPTRDIESYQNYRIHGTLSYKEILHSFFANASVSYSHKKSDMLFQNQFEQNATTSQEIAFIDNDLNSFSISGEAKKLFSDINTTASVRPSWSNSEFVQLINDEVVAFDNTNTEIDIKLSSDISTLNTLIEINQNWMYATNKFEELQSEYWQTFTNFSLDYYIKNKLSFGGTIEYYNNQLSGNTNTILFIDAEAAYTLAKRQKLFLEISNITNNEVFESVSINDNYSNSRFQRLRPRQCLVGFNFTF